MALWVFAPHCLFCRGLRFSTMQLKLMNSSFNFLKMNRNLCIFVNKLNLKENAFYYDFLVQTLRWCCSCQTKHFITFAFIHSFQCIHCRFIFIKLSFTLIIHGLCYILLIYIIIITNITGINRFGSKHYSPLKHIQVSW